MRIKRYFGKTVRQAIQKVREEQGPDAVILSNRKVDGGVEIVATVDFDETLFDTNAAVSPPDLTPSTAQNGSTPPPQRGSPAASPLPRPESAVAKRIVQADAVLKEMRRELAGMRGLLEQQFAGLIWGEVARRNPLQAKLLRMLLKLELSPRLCEQLVAELPATDDARLAWRDTLVRLAHRLPVTDDDILTHGGAVALFGPTGVGKTTTCAKLAARYAVRHGARHVALVTTDNYRIGAHEQLRAYAKLLDIPLRVAASAEELKAVVNDLGERRLVLIDTAGMSQRDQRLGEQFALFRTGAKTAIQCYVVLAATTHKAGIAEILSAYAPLRPTGCILTKVDEATSLGGLISRLIEQRLPVAYMSDGQRVPEDLYAARAHQLVTRCVALMRRTTALAANGSAAMAAAPAGGLAHAC